MWFFETGLSQYISESKVTFHVRIAMLFYNFALESMPETLEGLHKFIKDQNHDDLFNLSYANLISAFYLLFFSCTICLIICLLELSYFFLS